MWKPKYHISPEYGLLNDPNGLIYFNGYYHVFYQWNPNECAHGPKSWAHMRSRDMIKWETLPVALTPDKDYDKNGCYSGSAIVKDDTLYLFYTGNVKNNGVRASYQCLAISQDGINFEKKGPVIDDMDIPKGYTRHFRDPKVFKSKDRFLMVIGAQREDLSGTIVVFSSTDLLNWRFEEEIIEGDFGFMCECPDYIEEDGKHALIFSPQGLEPNGYLYNNRYQSGYIVRELFEKEKNDFTELDRGFEFYAPQTFKDEDGITTLIGWMGMPEELEHPSVKDENWVHMLTLPRELEIKNGKIYQHPHRNLKKLRKNEIKVNNLTLNNSINLKDFSIKGHTYELEIEFEKLKNDIEIKFCKSDNEETVISYSCEKRVISLNRERSGKGYKGIRKCKIETLSNIRLFVDNSSFELFINNGEEVFTGNIYPQLQSDEIEILSSEKILIPKISFYNI